MSLLSPDATARAQDVTDSERLEHIEAALWRLVDFSQPGTRGIEGAEQTPELFQHQFTARDDRPYPVPSNHKRSALLLNNQGPGDAYLVHKDAQDTSEGFPLPNGAEREIQVTNTVYVMAASGTTADIRVWEEST